MVGSFMANGNRNLCCWRTLGRARLGRGGREGPQDLIKYSNKAQNSIFPLVQHIVLTSETIPSNSSQAH